MTPVPWQAGQRPRSTLNEKWAGGDPAATLASEVRGEELADLVVGLDVGDRVRAAGAAERALVDQRHVDQPVEARPGASHSPGSTSTTPARALVGAVEDVLDQRRLARAGDAGDRDQRAEREVDVDVLQVVGAGAAHRDPRQRCELLGERLPALLAAEPGHVPAGLGRRPLAQIARRSASPRWARISSIVPSATTWPPCSPAAGPEVDDVVGAADQRAVVLHHQHRVAARREVAQQGEQAARCPADGGRSSARRARRGCW